MNKENKKQRGLLDIQLDRLSNKEDSIDSKVSANTIRREFYLERRLNTDYIANIENYAYYDTYKIKFSIIHYPDGGIRLERTSRKKSDVTTHNPNPQEEVETFVKDLFIVHRGIDIRFSSKNIKDRTISEYTQYDYSALLASIDAKAEDSEYNRYFKRNAENNIPPHSPAVFWFPRIHLTHYMYLSNDHEQNTHFDIQVRMPHNPHAIGHLIHGHRSGNEIYIYMGSIYGLDGADELTVFAKAEGLHMIFNNGHGYHFQRLLNRTINYFDLDNGYYSAGGGVAQGNDMFIISTMNKHMTWSVPRTPSHQLAPGMFIELPEEQYYFHDNLHYSVHGAVLSNSDLMGSPTAAGTLRNNISWAGGGRCEVWVRGWVKT